MLKSYVKIFPASGKFQDWFIGKDVEITEKIDGSQFVFGKDPTGKLFMRSKGAVINPDYPPNLFAPAVTHVLYMKDWIPSDTAYYGETICKPKHNTLTYGSVPNNAIMLYGVTDFARTKNLCRDWNDLARLSAELNLEPVPLLFKGILESLVQLTDFMHLTSKLGGCKLEGVVVKNYNQDALMGGEYFPLVAMKYVSEAFKEQHQKNPEYRPKGASVDEYALSYRTEARWNKAIQHLRDDGQLVFAPKDIGNLMNELERDFEEECKQEVMDFLYKTYKRTFLKSIKNGFPEHYKQWLLTNGAECSPSSTETSLSTESASPPNK